jgi:hypothetical protein
VFGVRVFAKTFEIIGTKHRHMIETRAGTLRFPANDLLVLWVYILMLLKTMTTKAHACGANYLTIKLFLISPSEINPVF